ncbi:MAG: hypothetical protein EBR40_11610 [Proteobacteria bacterium]|nr:hypothetical protein [Pseudomonadota bacterium]
MNTCNNQKNEQKFTFDDKNRLINNFNNKCLTITDDPTARNSYSNDVWQQDCKNLNYTNQTWKYNRETGEILSLYQDNKCLDISNNRLGSSIIANQCDNSRDQKWYMNL